MLVLSLGLGLTAILLGSVTRWHSSRAADLGAMSDPWIAAYHKSPLASWL